MASLRNTDLSVYFFIKNIDLGGGRTLGDFATILDSYPFNELENDSLVVPSISIEHRTTSDVDAGELGASWFRRGWEINVFASSDTQRDEIGDLIFQQLDRALPLKDFSGGYKLETGTKISGAPLDILEYMQVEVRVMRPAYSFNLHQKIKYWRITITFDTISTQAS